MLKVSVIMPVYNAERFLHECLDSVTNQTLKDIEIICVDDVSTDSSVRIMEGYAKNDDRIKILRQPENQLAGAARNRGMTEAKGKYLVFWDADDFFEPDALERMYLKCEEDEADVCICGGRIYDMRTKRLASATHYLNLKFLPTKLPFTARDCPDTAFMICNPAPWNKMYRREFILKEGLQFPRFRRGEDLVFVCTAIAVADRITAVDRILINYRAFTSTSLQETSDAFPFVFYESLCAWRKALRDRGIFELYEKSFVNVALGVCLADLRFSKTREAWFLIAKRLKNEIFDDLGCTGKPGDYFISQTYYGIMKDLLDTPTGELAKRQPPLRKDERHKETGFRDAPGADGALKVSVVIPVYNVEDYVEECLRSVMGQSLEDIEIICVDDGATDGSAAIVEQLCMEDDRIRLIRQENAGLSMARNNGIREAKGEYIALLDSDDIFAWCALEHLYYKAKEDGLDELFFAGESFFDPIELYEDHASYRKYFHYKEDYDSVVSGAELFAQLIENWDFKPSAPLQLLRRGFLEEEGIAFFPGILHEDNLFTLQCLMKAKRASVLNEPLYIRRMRPDSIMTADKSWSHAYGYFVCIREAHRSLHECGLKDSVFLAALVRCEIEIGWAIGEALKSLTEDEVDNALSSLPAEEQIEFRILMEDIGRLRSAGRRNRGLNQSIPRKQALIKEEQKKARSIKAEIDRIRCSSSYNLGKLITSPLRLVKRLMVKAFGKKRAAAVK